jgi:hypothetical protein
LRYIDTDPLAGLLPDKWGERAKKALERVRDAKTAKERSDALTACAPIWHEAKDALATLSHDMCWYCQTEQVRSDNNVDHYRPKGNVVESPSHKGYWWLAFAIENFRYSCTFCNSHRKDRITGAKGGKQDHFPVFNEKKRAKKEGESYDEERPLLLDPTVDLDTTMLWFEPDGRVVETHDKETSADLHERARISILLYHLNESKLKIKRRDLCKDIVDLIDEGDKHYRDHVAGNPAGERGFASVIRRLRKRLRPKAEYTATAMAMVVANCDAKHPWLRAALSGL